MKNYNNNFFSFEEMCKSFISLRELSKFIPYEFNFWVFLLIFLEFSHPYHVNVDSPDCIILVFCFLAILTIFINFFIILIKKLSFNGKFLIFFSLYLFSLFFFFQILIIILPFFLYRFSLSIFLASLSTCLIFLLWIFQEDQEVSFSSFFKSWLPLIIFFFLLLSLGFWADFLNLMYPFLFFLIYNFSFIKTFFYEDWKPMILRSSLLWNLYRFFLPGAFFSEILIFCFGSEFLIAGPGLLGWLKLQSLTPKISGYDRFLSLKPKPSLFFSQASQIVRFFSSFYTSEDMIIKFVKKNLVILIDELSKSKEQGFPSETLKTVLQEVPSQLTIKPLILHPNFSTTASREFLHFFILQNFFQQSYVVPASWFFNGYENLPAIHPRVLVEYEDISDILKDFFEIKKVDSPFIFNFKKIWYFALNLTEVNPITGETINNLLDDLTNRPEFWKHSFSSFSGNTLALFPLNDFLIFSYFDLQLERSVQAKSSLIYIRDTKTDSFSVLNIKKQDFSIYSNQPLLPKVHFEELNVIKEEAKKEDFQLVVSRNFSQIERILNDEILLNQIRFDVAKEVIPRGAILLKKDLLLTITKKNEDI